MARGRIPGARSLWRLAPLVLLALSCYRPRAIDCVMACDPSGACPSGLRCSVGLCTHGPTCLRAIAAGARHSCAARAQDLVCWGNNSYGQLGIGSTESRGGDQAPLSPVDLGSGRVATAVAAGGRHTCALVGAADGGDTALSLACWGDNAFGQLGLSDRAPRGAAPGSGPAVVPLAPGRTVSAIAAGLDHTCGLLDDGTIRCWGDNRLGQLGVAGPSPASAAEATPVSVGASARALAAGAYHSCALLSTGDVSCWGWNEHGQLGDTDSPAGSVVAVNLGGQQAIAVTAGGFYSCAILQGGAVTCWGRIDAGQKPRPNPSTTETPILDAGTRIALGTGRSAREIVAGTSHACALLDDFSVKCWGFNGDGELGVGDTANRGDDETLGDGLPRVLLGGGPVSHLAGGARHTCAVQEAAVKCWGLNDSGRLGVGDQQNRGDDPGHSITAASFGGGGR